MENITKVFPGVKALDGVSLTVKAGTVHALMGENGAGKSTLMKCLFGIYRPDAGRIRLDGKDVEFRSTKEALDGGVAMVHQELSQAMRLSVMDNMFLGRIPLVWRHLPFVSEMELYKRTREVLDELGMDIDPRAPISSLSVSKRQMIEIAKAVSYRARIIVLDEPTSSLNEAEAEKLFGIIELLRSRGCGIIYISHKMDEIFRIADEITVMRDGRYITTRPKYDITMDEIIRLMVGRTLEERYPEKSNELGEELFSVENLSSESAGLSEISLSLHRGEILGIAGLDGSGRTETLECIFGLRRHGGILRVEGRVRDIRSPRAAIGAHIAFISEERRQNGIFPVLSVQENTVISSLKKFNTGPLLSSSRMRAATMDGIKKLRIKTPSEKARIKNLSGGNQQKVILSRWLLTEPEVLLLDEPTRGIDVGAKYEIYKLIIGLAEEGRGIILVSSEMGELLGLCDRIAVLSDGTLSGILTREEATQEKIMRLASGEKV